MKNLLQLLLKSIGLQLKRYPAPEPEMDRRQKIVQGFNISVLLDVGANVGQYASQMRMFGYKNKIISFEPLKEAFEKLKIAAAKDQNWRVENYGLGAVNSRSLINVSRNSFSSSVLNMLPKHLSVAPESEYVAREEIEIKRLDSIASAFFVPREKIMLKIDTQGFEKQVLEGAGNLLGSICLLQVEMSLVPLYEGEHTLVEMINYLKEKGFQLYSIENGFSDNKTGQLLQVDGVFVNEKIVGKLKD
jgi:FkbM family methyltransferase